MAAVTTLKPRGGRRQKRHLGPEPWGHRIARAREQAGWTQRTISSSLDGLKGYSYGTIQRLESEVAVPTDKLSRQRAHLLLTAYRFDPADFGLGDDDRPPLVDYGSVLELDDMAADLRGRTSPCMVYEVDFGARRTELAPLVALGAAA